VDHHPTLAELEGLVLGDISVEEAHAVIWHLFRGCGACGVQLAPYLPVLLGKLGRESRSTTIPPAQLEVYDAPLERAFAAVGVRMPPPKTAEEKKQEALKLLCAGGLEGLPDVPSDLLGLPLYEALLERSWALRHDDPDQMVQLARSAVFLADRLSEDELGVQKTVDLRCRAWVELANAYRVADELDQAEDALGWATECLMLGNQDDLLMARFFDVLGSFYAARRRFDLVSTALDLVAFLYSRHGDEHLAGRALISKGIYVGYEGELQEALRLLQQGLALVNEDRDSGVVASALQAQARFLADSGSYKEARVALWSLRQRKLRMEGRISALKLQWLEGQINAGLEKFDRAERDLKQVKQGFEEAGLGYKAALAGLELGAVWLRQGRLAEAERMVSECAAVFISLQIRRELRVSILVIRQAVETRHLNLTVLQHVIDLLHKAERDPNAPTLEEP
jgi:tetratricopeptide (TPR) repeat protein